MYARIIKAVLLSVCILYISACGRKALPVPPNTIQPPVVKKFQADLDNFMVRLTWDMPVWDGKGENALAGYYVYRSMEELSSKVCKDCPIPFNRVADVKMDQVVVISNRRAVFEETVEKGFRYHYKVSWYTESGVEGDFSRVVSVEY